MDRSAHHPYAFPALFIGSSALAFGPWLVRLSGVGPVAAGFWRLALALPFLWFIAVLTRQPVHWPGRAADRDGRLLLRRRPRRLARRHPPDQARQRDPVRQHVELRLRRMGAVAGAADAVAAAECGAAPRRGRRRAVDGEQRRAVHAQPHGRPPRALRGASLHRLSDRGSAGSRHDPAAPFAVHRQRIRRGDAAPCLAPPR